MGVVGHHTQGTVTAAVVGGELEGGDDPVPAKLAEDDLQGPHAAGGLGLVRADTVRSPTDARPPPAVADAELDVRDLGTEINYVSSSIYCIPQRYFFSSEPALCGGGG